MDELDRLAQSSKVIVPESVPGVKKSRGTLAGAGGFAAAATKPPAGDQKEIGPQFRRFLSQVGEAMIDAQQELDGESRKYLTGAVPAAMPAMFRLPRLNAKVQFDFADETESGLNFVFYRKTSNTKELRQHTLEFEIVAAPPPPGFNPPIPGWRLLTGNERATALAALSFGTGERLVLWELPVPGGNSVLLLADAPSPTTGQLPQSTLVLIGAAKHALATLPFQATADPGAAVSQLVGALQALAEKQVALGG